MFGYAIADRPNHRVVLVSEANEGSGEAGSPGGLKGAARSRPKAVVGSGGPICAGCAESADIRRSDRERAGAFEVVSSITSAVRSSGAFWPFTVVVAPSIS